MLIGFAVLTNCWLTSRLGKQEGNLCAIFFSKKHYFNCENLKSYWCLASFFAILLVLQCWPSEFEGLLVAAVGEKDLSVVNTAEHWLW